MKRNIFNFLLITMASIAIIGGCTEKELGNPAPSTVADFKINTITNEGYAPLEVTFENLSLNATSYLWDFGNGQTSTEMTPSTQYETPGLYNVVLTCGSTTDLYYNKLVKSLVINVKDPLAGLTQVLYYTSRSAGPGGVHMVILDDNTPLIQDFETTDMVRPYGIAVDTASRKVFVTDYNIGAIYRFDADGKNPEKILSREYEGQAAMLEEPQGIVVVGDKVYWGSPGGIFRANLDGSNPEAYYNSQGQPPEYPLDMNYHAGSSKFYMANDYAVYSGGFYSCNFDGSGMQELIPGIDGTALEVNFETGIAYLAVYPVDGSPITDYGIYTCNLDGSAITKIGDFGSKATWGIAIDHERDKLFWGYKISNSNPDGKIVRANLDGSSPEDWITGVSPHAMTIVFIKL